MLASKDRQHPVAQAAPDALASVALIAWEPCQAGERFQHAMRHHRGKHIGKVHVKRVTHYKHAAESREAGAEGRLIRLLIVRTGAALLRRLTRVLFRRQIFAVLVPRETGDERGNTGPRPSLLKAAIRGCPRNCERRALRPRGHWATGKAGRSLKSDDPRARRPASAVTQPVDGASIRSGLSQR